MRVARIVVTGERRTGSRRVALRRRDTFVAATTQLSLKALAVLKFQPMAKDFLLFGS